MCFVVKFKLFISCFFFYFVATGELENMILTRKQTTIACWLLVAQQRR